MLYNWHYQKNLCFSFEKGRVQTEFWTSGWMKNKDRNLEFMEKAGEGLMSHWFLQPFLWPQENKSADGWLLWNGWGRDFLTKRVKCSFPLVFGKVVRQQLHGRVQVQFAWLAWNSKSKVFAVSVLFPECPAIPIFARSQHFVDAIPMTSAMSSQRRVSQLGFSFNVLENDKVILLSRLGLRNLKRPPEPWRNLATPWRMTMMTSSMSVSALGACLDRDLTGPLVTFSVAPGQCYWLDSLNSFRSA